MMDEFGMTTIYRDDDELGNTVTVRWAGDGYFYISVREKDAEESQMAMLDTAKARRLARQILAG